MAENALAKVVSAGQGYVIVQDATGATVKRTGVRNWRNNNPGNLQGSDFSYSQPGVIGKDFYGDPVFDTYENGLAAQTKLIFGPSSVYKPLTVEQAIYKYTPPVVEPATGQKGNPESTINALIKDVPGITRNTPWSSLTPAQQQGVLKTLSKTEGYKVGTISEIDPAKIPVSPPPPGSETIIDPATGQKLRVASEEDIRRNGVLGGTNNARKTVEPAAESGVAQTINVTPMPNPLHAYASYTYGLSLAMLTIDEYNEVVKTQNYISKRVLIASAGRHSQTKDPSDPNQFTRAQYFSEDFYFENLEIETVIGFNERSRATNAIHFNFSIIEPFGMSLLDRIIKLAGSDEVKSRNYLEQPYLLQIDFFAINDAGIIVGALPEHTKRIPIKLLTLDIDATNKGAVYNIEAVLYSHSAYNVNTLATPAHFEIVAGTVASFFQSTETESSLTGTKQQRQPARQDITVGPDGLARGRTGEVVPLTAVDQRTAAIISADPIYKVKSYGSAYNAFYNDLVNTKKIKVADRVYFKFAEEFQKAKFLLGKNLSPKDTPMAEASTEITIRAGKTDAANANLDYKTAIFNVNAGTSIDMVINYVIRNSDYIQNQLTVPEDYGSDVASYLAKKNSNKDLPLKWFKIVPQVILTEYDSIRKVWGREITYNIIPYEVYNTKIAAAPQGTWSHPLKQYNYYYTGKNVDVLDFKIQFNALYFTAVTAYKRHMAATYGLTDYDDRELNPDKYGGTEDGPNAIQPMKESPVIIDSQARATGGSYTPTAAAAADVQQSLYTSAGGDMIQGSLRIIGDPQFIKQDDIFYPPYDVIDPISGKKGTPPATSDPRLIAGGSLSMDNREVYVEVTFKMPTDVNEVTGLVNFSSDFQQTSMFSGMYRVLTVKNTFNGGKFEQVLDIVRLPRQTSFEYSKNNQTTQRSETNEKSTVASAIPAPKETVTNKATPAPEALPAPNNNPIEESAPPLQSAEQKELANVTDKAEEKPITQATVTEAPPANPPTPSPTSEKLALKQRADALEVTKNTINSQYNAASDQVVALQSRLEQTQTNIDRYNNSVARGKLSQAEADQLIADNNERATVIRSQILAAEAEVNRLRPLNLQASSDFVEAKSAYARAS